MEVTAVVWTAVEDVARLLGPTGDAATTVGHTVDETAASSADGAAGMIGDGVVDETVDGMVDEMDGSADMTMGGMGGRDRFTGDTDRDLETGVEDMGYLGELCEVGVVATFSRATERCDVNDPSAGDGPNRFTGGPNILWGTMVAVEEVSARGSWRMLVSATCAVELMAVSMVFT